MSDPFDPRNTSGFVRVYPPPEDLNTSMIQIWIARSEPTEETYQKPTSDNAWIILRAFHKIYETLPGAVQHMLNETLQRILRGN